MILLAIICTAWLMPGLLGFITMLNSNVVDEIKKDYPNSTWFVLFLLFLSMLGAAPIAICILIHKHGVHKGMERWWEPNNGSTRLELQEKIDFYKKELDEYKKELDEVRQQGEDNQWFWKKKFEEQNNLYESNLKKHKDKVKKLESKVKVNDPIEQLRREIGLDK